MFVPLGLVTEAPPESGVSFCVISQELKKLAGYKAVDDYVRS